MRLKINTNDILIFIAFFLITIGEGTFILSNCGYKIEYIGYILLLGMIFEKGIKKRIVAKRIPKFLFILLLLCIGFWMGNAENATKISLTLSMIMLSIIAIYSDGIITNPDRIKSIGYSIFCAGIATCVIGILTGTLGVYWSFYDSYVGIIFQAGFRVKNYTGAVWLSVFVCLYIYDILSCKKHCVFFYLLLTILIVITGSKGAIILLGIFLFFANFDLIKMFGERNKKITYFFLSLIIIVSVVCLAEYYFPNMRTMAYRLNGVTQYLEIVSKNTERLVWGSADIAYENGAENYTNSLRNYIGWSGSIEVLVSNISGI